MGATWARHAMCESVLKVFAVLLRIFETFRYSLAVVHEDVALMLDVSTDTKFICLDVGVFGKRVITPDQNLFQFSPFIYSFIYLCIYLFNLLLKREIVFIVIT
jgi:hypothetical protein